MPRYPEAPPFEKLEQPVWEQQKGESKNNYLAFIQYQDLKPAERTIAAAWRVWTAGSKKEGAPITDYFRTITTIWHWKERASARDFHIATSQQSKWLERDQERRDQDYQLGSKLITQADRILEHLGAEPANGTLIDAKDVAVAGATLREKAIPSFQFAAEQIRWLLGVLPPEKSQEVLAAVQSIKRLQAPDVVEGEVRVIEE